jgi:hypothetical protein
LPNPDEFIPKAGVNLQSNAISTEMKPTAKPTPKVVVPQKTEDTPEGC